MTSLKFGIAVRDGISVPHKGDMVSSEVLAENICTNPARVRKVMAQLKRAGWWKRTGRRCGGLPLCGLSGYRDPVRHCAGGRCCVRFGIVAQRRWNKPCLWASGMGALMDEVYTGLDALCRNVCKASR